MSLLQLEDPIVGPTIDAILGSLQVQYTDVTGSPSQLSLANGALSVVAPLPLAQYKGDLIISTPNNSGMIQINDYQKSVGIGTYPVAPNQLLVSKDVSVTGSIAITGGEANPTGPFSRTIDDPVRGTITTTEYQVGSAGAGFGGPWQDCRYIYNNSAPDGGIVNVWSIVNDPSGGNVGDIRFSENAFVQKNLTVSGSLLSLGPVASPLNCVPLVVAGAGQTFALGPADFNQMKPYQVSSSGATISLPATASLPAGTFVTVFISPTSSGAMAVQGAFSSGESLGAGQSATYTVIQGNSGANYATWMRTQRSV